MSLGIFNKRNYQSSTIIKGISRIPSSQASLFCVFGESDGEFMAATAGVGPDGDRQGWSDFLEKAKTIFNEYGDIPFVHWHDYERQFLDKYVERYGDEYNVAAKVQENLVDLLPIMKKSVALPLPSYSLKVIEKHIGFERSQDEYGGDWAIATKLIAE